MVPEMLLMFLEMNLENLRVQIIVPCISKNIYKISPRSTDWHLYHVASTPNLKAIAVKIWRASEMSKAQNFLPVIQTQ